MQTLTKTQQKLLLQITQKPQTATQITQPTTKTKYQYTLQTLKKLTNQKLTNKNQKKQYTLTTQGKQMQEAIKKLNCI